MNRIQKKLIEDAYKKISMLGNDWDIRFIVDLNSKRDLYELTAKQNQHLNRISSYLAGNR